MIEDYSKSIEGKRRFSNPKIYELTLEFQKNLGKLGVVWHNTFADECTIDFCCCQGDNMESLGEDYPATNYKHYLPSYREVIKLALEELYEECKHGDKEHQDWLKNKFKSYLKQY